MAEPCDAGRQSLERDVAAREPDPVRQNEIVRKHVQQKIVDLPGCRRDRSTSEIQRNGPMARAKSGRR